MAWPTNIRKMHDDVDDILALALEIGIRAKDVWAESRDERLQAIIKDATQIHELARALNRRFYDQTTFGTGEEEPRRSRRQEDG